MNALIILSALLILGLIVAVVVVALAKNKANAELDSSNEKLAITNSQLATATSQLGNTTNLLKTTADNHTTCTSDLASCNANLASCSAQPKVMPYGTICDKKLTKDFKWYDGSVHQISDTGYIEQVLAESKYFDPMSRRFYTDDVTTGRPMADGVNTLALNVDSVDKYIAYLHSRGMAFTPSGLAQIYDGSWHDPNFTVASLRPCDCDPKSAVSSLSPFCD